MRPIWEIDGEDVENLQGDSTGFVRFLNALLGFQADAGRLPDSAVHLNQKDTEGDGGVDAVITRAISSGLDPTGRFGVPTCWQFKASPTENIKAKVAKGVEGGGDLQLLNERHKSIQDRKIGGHRPLLRTEPCGFRELIPQSSMPNSRTRRSASPRKPSLPLLDTSLLSIPARPDRWSVRGVFPSQRLSSE